MNKQPTRASLCFGVFQWKLKLETEFFSYSFVKIHWISVLEGEEDGRRQMEICIFFIFSTSFGKRKENKWWRGEECEEKFSINHFLVQFSFLFAVCELKLSAPFFSFSQKKLRIKTWKKLKKLKFKDKNVLNNLFLFACFYPLKAVALESKGWFIYFGSIAKILDFLFANMQMKIFPLASSFFRVLYLQWQRHKEKRLIRGKNNFNWNLSL